VLVESARELARVSVRDDGPGIAPGRRSRVFDPGETTKPGGWGLGLPLARRIVEQQHGGRLSYHPGNPGSLFILEFPLGSGDRA
jgi:signal transduction histidine kinase